MKIIDYGIMNSNLESSLDSSELQKLTGGAPCGVQACGADVCAIDVCILDACGVNACGIDLITVCITDFAPAVR